MNEPQEDERGRPPAVDRRSILRAMAATGLAGGAVGVADGRASGGAGSGGRTTAGSTLLATVSTDLPNEITVVNTGSGSDRVEYRLAVDGQLEHGDDAGENEAIENGNAVTGLVEGPGRDNYHFAGRTTTFKFTEGTDVAKVLLDGEEVDDPEGLPEPGAEQCVEIEPLQYRDRTVTEFYGYTPDLSDPNPRQSNTPTNLERAGVSRLFLFEGPDGLSLVVTHGGGEGEEGGAASFEITGLPADGEWVVLDDSHGGSDDVFEIGETTSSMHWAWGVGTRNDGGAFRGLGDEFRIRIDPSFGEAARRDPLGPGRVRAMQVLSGSATDPEVIPVPMDEPLVISTVEERGECPPVGDSDDADDADDADDDAKDDAEARIVDLSVAQGTFEPGDVVPAEVTIENTGSTSHTFYVGYSVFGPDGRGRHNDGTTDEPLTLDAGETRTTTVEWTVESDAPGGSYDAHVIVWRDRRGGELRGNLDDRWRRNAFEVRETG